MKSMPGLPKLLTDYVEVFRIKLESALTQAESLQILGAANTIISLWNLDSLPTACFKTKLLPYEQS